MHGYSIIESTDMKQIYISREGQTFRIKRDLTEEEKRNTWRRQKTVTETLTEAPAKVISPRLALFQYEKPKSWGEARYHVIHIATGLVIADVTYDLVKDVKETFENSEWTLQGDNTFVMHNGTFTWEMTCRIRYDIRKEID